MLERQAGMVNRCGATAAQVCGTAVGAYLNSDDLSGGGRDAAGNPLPGSGGYKMMVTLGESDFAHRQARFFRHLEMVEPLLIAAAHQARPRRLAARMGTDQTEGTCPPRFRLGPASSRAMGA